MSKRSNLEAIENVKRWVETISDDLLETETTASYSQIKRYLSEATEGVTLETVIAILKTVQRGIDEVERNETSKEEQTYQEK